MGKRINKKAKEGKETFFGIYQKKFELLELGTKKHLRDEKSDRGSFVPIEICGDSVYLSESDGKLIPDDHGQQKCDFLLYCSDLPQTCFMELKGANISSKSRYNPYDQIMDTVRFLQKDEILRNLVNSDVEKHAFIVSPGRQKIPKGIETKKRQLWQLMVQNGKEKKKIYDLIHYVKVTKTDRYSNNDQIVCSPKSPIKIPFKN